MVQFGARILFTAVLISGALLPTVSMAGVPLGSSVGFEAANLEQVSFPEGCTGLFQEPARFLPFYESSVATMAASRGSEAKGVVDLFAVAQMRDALANEMPNMSEESPIDRLVIKQLCNYQKIRNQEIGPGRTRVEITSGDLTLHDHLATISAQLYRDSRTILVEALAEKRKAEQADAKLAAGKDQVRRARNLAREKIKPLLF